MSEDIKGKCCECGKGMSVWDNTAYLDDNGIKKYYCRDCFKNAFKGSYPYLPSFCSGFDLKIDLCKNPLKS